MNNLKAPLVGQHFYPPAKGLLQVLAQGTPLVLVREPENKYDRNAIKVMLESKAISPTQYDDLEVLVAGYGLTTAEVLAQASWQLGHVAAKTGEAGIISPIMDKEPARCGTEWPKASLQFDSAGKPQVLVEFD